MEEVKKKKKKKRPFNALFRVSKSLIQTAIPKLVQAI
jgi:hypothetical protein